jgi:hypothetical protein
MPTSQPPLSAAASSIVLGAALGVVFVALFVATSGPWHELLRRPDAVLPMLLLLVNMSGLFTGLMFAAASGAPPAGSGRHARRFGRVPALAPIASHGRPFRGHAADSTEKTV